MMKWLENTINRVFNQWTRKRKKSWAERCMRCGSYRYCKHGSKYRF